MVDDFERKHGYFVDRCEFDGDFVVPPHLKNLAHMFAVKTMRLQGGLFGSLSRSRTFLTLQTNSRDYLHSSVPDLSRSAPTTPGSSQRMHLANSVESVLEENNDPNGLRGLGATTTNNGTAGSTLMASHEMRRMSEQDSIEYKRGIMKISKMINNKQPIVYTTTPSHFRNNSEPMNRLFPLNSKIPPPPPSQITKKPNNIVIIDGHMPSSSRSNKNHTNNLNNNNNNNLINQQQQKTAAAAVLYSNNQESVLSSCSMHNISALDASSISKWGNVRNSNSFSSELNVNTLSRYTIPRVSLLGSAGNGGNNDGNSRGAGTPKLGIVLTDGRQKSPHNGVDDSAA